MPAKWGIDIIHLTMVLYERLWKNFAMHKAYNGQSLVSCSVEVLKARILREMPIKELGL